MSAILVDCCTKRNIKTLQQNNAVCLICQRHYYEGREYTKKEWDALMEAAEIMQPKQKIEPNTCSNCFCWEDGFCTSGDSMEPGERRHIKVSGDSRCEAHARIEQPND